jgi:hypothetical protein
MTLGDKTPQWLFLNMTTSEQANNLLLFSLSLPMTNYDGFREISVEGLDSSSQANNADFLINKTITRIFTQKSTTTAQFRNVTSANPFHFMQAAHN